MCSKRRISDSAITLDSLSGFLSFDIHRVTKHFVSVSYLFNWKHFHCAPNEMAFTITIGNPFGSSVLMNYNYSFIRSINEVSLLEMTIIANICLHLLKNLLNTHI